jgi:hypothetical protein
MRKNSQIIADKRKLKVSERQTSILTKIGDQPNLGLVS